MIRQQVICRTNRKERARCSSPKKSISRGVPAIFQKKGPSSKPKQLPIKEIFPILLKIRSFRIFFQIDDFLPDPKNKSHF
ncbi:hypothetical protein DLM75_07090 [Leptospira stimsonii]|uniref:Uncharacterized protein n=1 Tax=Leptospira stimsonii TaxID=2202203 RepID=A0A396ZCC2_9LEPT|nr:hypothetical protein DLM75_07090 [Leptospira stimsonii]